MFIHIPLFLAGVIISPAFSSILHTIRHEALSDLVPCERGWYYFSNKCYKAEGRKMSARLTWRSASSRCQSLGGNLVSINSQEEQDFLVTFLQLDVHFRTWIGLHDLKSEGKYEWSDDSDFSYNNWNEGEPSGRKFGVEDCVQLVFEPWSNIVGKWNDASCDMKDSYICEKNTNSGKETPNHMYCPSKEGGGFKYKSSCFHFIKETDSWHNAEAHCKDKFNGHLVTIRDQLEDIFLDFVLGNVEEEVWIGIKIRDQYEQRWTSGFYASYNAFDDESNLIEGNCVARKKRKEWITVPCSRQLSYVCEVSRAVSDGFEGTECGSHTLHKVLIGLFVSIILVAILMGVVLFYFRPCGIEFIKKSAAEAQAKKYSSMKELMLKKDNSYETMK